MKRIVCEMCGGTDLVKQEGLFVCQSCGCKYTVEEARKMMVEIDGPVEVTGTVRVDNTAAADNYLRMAGNALAAGNNKEAEDYANRVIEVDAKNWKAWMVKGKAAGWQSTVKDIRFSESVYAFGQALACVPEEEKAELLEEAREEIKKLGVALVKLRASRFEKWPDDEETAGFENDLSAIFQTMIQFIGQTGSVIKMDELMRPIAETITASVRSAWENLIRPEFEKDGDGCPSDHALERLIDRAGNCLTIMRKVTSLSDEKDEKNFSRYGLMISIQRFCINAKSWEEKTWTDYRDTWEGRQYFTRSQKVVSKELTASAIALRKQEIKELEEKRNAITKADAERRKAEKEEKKRKEQEASAGEETPPDPDWETDFRTKYSKQLGRMIHAGGNATLGIKLDGTVLAAGCVGVWKNETPINLDKWTSIIDVAISEFHVVGLKADGRADAAGDHSMASINVKSENKFKVRNWENIVGVAAGIVHSIGLRRDGKVIAAGMNQDGQCKVDEWRNIVAVDANGSRTVGLRADGTVVATGSNMNGEGNVSSWENIAAISAGGSHTLGLKKDGTVVSTQYIPRKDLSFSKYYGQCDVEGWSNIVAISAGGSHSVGLKADGTVVAVGNNDYGQCEVDGWKDILAISAGGSHTIGLRTDGTVVSTVYRGTADTGKTNVTSWRLFDSAEQLKAEFEAEEMRAEAERKAAAEKAEAERKAAAEKAEAERKAKIEALTKEKAQLEAELPNVKGLFAGSKKAKIDARLAEIEAELKKLG